MSSKENAIKPAEKKKALEGALAQIEKAFGKGSIMKLSNQEQNTAMEVISTGSLGLDIALGVGGIARDPFFQLLPVFNLARIHCRHHRTDAGGLGEQCDQENEADVYFLEIHH